MSKDELKRLALNLMFTMSDSEYDTLSEEFEIILKQMDLIGNIENITDVEPMFYPFPLADVVLREDKVLEELDVDDVLANCSSTLYNQVKLPKVVEK